jgi:outer membrane protein assembly factor BamD (BamD/ComL family)
MHPPIGAIGNINKIKIVIIAVFFCSLLCLNAWSDDESSAPAMDTYNKAVRLYEAKHWDAAKDYFHEYLAEYSDTPLYVTCLYYLAYCYQQLGDKNQAILLYHKVIDQAQGGDAFWGDMAQKRIQEILG